VKYLESAGARVVPVRYGWVFFTLYIKIAIPFLKCFLSD
jgi:hypothetical protein